jgi:uncharacterized protein YdeI (YjbR/CyaY-like superfamily)
VNGLSFGNENDGRNGRWGMNSADGSQILLCADAAEWVSWLSDHHRKANEIWLVVAKKGFESDGIVIEDALDAALCFGWIDSHRKGRDDRSFLQRYSPRRPRTPWSQLNVNRAERLMNLGRMQEAGLREVLAAQADGRWVSAYASQAEAVVPPEFQAALNTHPPSAAAYYELSKSAQYAIILPILKAVDVQIRVRRVQTALSALGSSGKHG